MALIVFHAGMPKTGSTTLQEWLVGNLDFLAGRGILFKRIAQGSEDEPIKVVAATSESVASKLVLPRGRGIIWPEIVERICVALAAATADCDTLVVSSESYEVLFNRLIRFDQSIDRTDPAVRRAMLAPLDALARSHTVRIAYYVRPQDAWLESAWLQWGFRNEKLRPRGWVLMQRERIDYLQTLLDVREAAPDLSFAMRPFRGDLLHGGDIVSDFAYELLGLDELPAGSREGSHANPAMPLEAAILMRYAPPGLFWSDLDDNRRLYPLKEMIRPWVVPEADLRARSREVLRQYAYATFEPGNQTLIDELGWNASHFVHPPEQELSSDPDAALVELNALWESKASPAERALLFSALDELVERKEPPRASVPVDGPVAVDVAADAGLDLLTRTFGAVVFDYDNDGWPDIFLGRHDAAPFLFRNRGGHFARVTSVEFPLPADRHCAAAGDLTGDGRNDIFCVIGGASGHASKGTGNELWIQQPDGTFSNVGDQPGLADPFGRGREAILFDATGNGLLDIFVGNVSPRSDGKPSPNRLFLNEGGGRFRPAPEMGLDLEYSVGGAGKPGSPHGGGNWPMGRLRAIDANGDGWTDIVMSAKHPEGKVQSVHLFRNDSGRGFTDGTEEAGLAGIAALDLAVADMTGDGRPDLVIVSPEGLTICLNERGRFRIGYHRPIGQAFRVAVADADGDGHPDIYVMRTRGVPGPDVPDLLLLRNGGYDDYTPIALPTVPGTVRSDDVYPIDFDGDGRAEFLVLHGHSVHPAPIQLIKLR